MNSIPRLTVYLLAADKVEAFAPTSSLTRYDLASMARSCHVYDAVESAEVARLHRESMTRVAIRLIDHPDYRLSPLNYRAAMDAWHRFAATIDAKTVAVAA